MKSGRPRQIRRKRPAGTAKRHRKNPKQRAAIVMRAHARRRKGR